MKSSKEDDSVVNYTDISIDARLLLCEHLDLAQNELIGFEEMLTRHDWRDDNVVSIRSAMHHQHIGKPVRVLGYISSAEPNRPANVGAERTTIISVALKDRQDSEIKCLALRVGRFDGLIEECISKRQHCIFSGTVYPMLSKDKSTTFAFAIHRIDTAVTSENLIHVRQEERIAAAAVVKQEGKKKGGIFRYIKEALTSGLGIKGLDKAKELDRCIDFMILQSLSNGRQGNISYKLHSLVIGPPSSGKKLLTDIAKVLNPVFEEGSAVGRKMTPAGLIGRVKKGKNGEISSEPGYLPRASGGVFCIEDFHGVQANRGDVMTSFAEVMENGTATDATIARTTHEALTSVHLDMNRQTQLNPGMPVDKWTDVDIYANVIARIDFVMEIPEDRTRQLDVAKEMLAGAQTLNSTLPAAQNAEWQRKLKVLVAYLRTHYMEARINAATAEYIQQRFQEIIDANRQYIELTQYFMLQTNATRLVNSIKKFVKALACASQCADVTEKHVDQAFEFIQEKLRFLSQYEALLKVPDFKASEKEKRQEALYKEFKGRKVSPKELLEFVNRDANGHRVTRQTINRDLKEMKAAKLSKGLWRIS